MLFYITQTNDNTIAYGNNTTSDQALILVTVHIEYDQPIIQFTALMPFILCFDWILKVSIDNLTEKMSVFVSFFVIDRFVFSCVDMILVKFI